MANPGGKLLPLANIWSRSLWIPLEEGVAGRFWEGVDL